MSHSGCKAIFTCLPLLDTCMKGIEKAKIPNDKVFLLPLADKVTEGIKNPGHKTVEDLIKQGAKLPKQGASDEKWEKGEGARRTAFLCYSSGTSGLPKGVMIPHKSVIANTIQICTHETPAREEYKKEHKLKHFTENCLGLLPMSHIYGLVVISHVGPYRGDGVVVLPKYDFKALLSAIQEYKIAMLYLVPPMIIHLTNAKKELQNYDLSSVTACFTGAAPLGEETADALLKMFPNWALKQGYGLTETSTVVCATAPFDIWLGSSGSLLPGYTARIITVEGEEINEYGKPGELVVKSPSVVLGYLNNKKATDETFVELEDGRYMKTGDEAMIKKSSKGHEHIFITDRIKEYVVHNPSHLNRTILIFSQLRLIKVKGNQVAPAELESHLLAHPAVEDCVVIGIPSEREGEVPKAFVVKDKSAEGSDEEIQKSISKHVADHKTNYKWLRGGVEFIDIVPKSASGKILRRLIRDQEKEKMKKQGPKL